MIVLDLVNLYYKCASTKEQPYMVHAIFYFKKRVRGASGLKQLIEEVFANQILPPPLKQLPNLFNLPKISLQFKLH